MNKSIFIAMLFLAVSACSTNPNSKFYKGGFFTFTVEEVEQSKFIVVAKGAGTHTKDELASGLQLRAEELCGGPAEIKDVDSKYIECRSFGGGAWFIGMMPTIFKA